MLGKVPGCPLSREWRLLVLSRERLVVFSRGSRTLAFPREQRSSGSRGLERLMHWWHRLPLNVVYAALTVGYMLAASVFTLFLQRDRKSVVSGKSVSVRVDTGGRRIIKKKKKETKANQ